MRDTVQRDSQDLGGNAAAVGSNALLRQMEQNLYKGAQSEATVVDEKLERFAGFVRNSAFYAHQLYAEPDTYLPMEVLPPDAANAHTYSMQLVLQSETVSPADVAAEAGLLANLVHLWEPVMRENAGNIAHYAYDAVTGSATVRVGMEEAPAAACVTFIDHGKPYDPLSKPDTDITLSAEERPIGGLGIFMVKKTMDAVTYEYKDGQNIVTIKKNC